MEIHVKGAGTLNELLANSTPEELTLSGEINHVDAETLFNNQTISKLIMKDLSYTDDAIQAEKNTSVKEIIIENGTENVIEQFPFRFFIGKQKVTLPEETPYGTLEEFDFWNKDLREIVISKDNYEYATQDGVLFNKEKTELIFFPRQDEPYYVIPKTVEKIRRGAFSSLIDIYYFQTPTSPEIEEEVFDLWDEDRKYVFYIPKGSMQAYREEFFDNDEELNFIEIDAADIPKPMNAQSPKNDGAFEEWLNKKYEATTAKARLNNIKKIESVYGSLDAIYENDKCEALLKDLNYTAKDEANDAPARHKIPLKGNVRNGSATYKQALKLFVEFKESSPKLRMIKDDLTESEIDILTKYDDGDLSIDEIQEQYPEDLKAILQLADELALANAISFDKSNETKYIEKALELTFEVYDAEEGIYNPDDSDLSDDEKTVMIWMLDQFTRVDEKHDYQKIELLKSLKEAIQVSDEIVAEMDEEEDDHIQHIFLNMYEKHQNYFFFLLYQFAMLDDELSEREKWYMETIHNTIEQHKEYLRDSYKSLVDESKKKGVMGALISKLFGRGK